MDADPGVRHLFVCGLHRSGTSPLHRLLRSQPGVAGFVDTSAKEDEGQHLQTAISSARAHGGPGLFVFDPRSILEASDATPAIAQQLRSQWASHWDSDARWLIEKSPPNLVRMPFLASVYPNSAFVVLTRHPVAVSLATWKWTRHSHLETLVAHWLLAHEVAREHTATMGEVRWLSYEEFIRSPRPAARWCLRVGDADDIRLDEPIRQGGNDRYFSRWEDLRGSWRSKRMMERLIAHFERPVRAFGYSLVDLERAPAFLPEA